MIECNIVKAGEVYAIDAATCRCKVTFPDMDDAVTSWLPISLPGGTRNRRKSLPKIGDMAWCALIAPSLSDGVVIGFTYNEVDQPPEGSEQIECTEYPDGTRIEYDAENKKLIINCVGDIDVTCKKINVKTEKATIEGDVEIIGDLVVTKTISAPSVKIGGTSVKGRVKLKLNGSLTVNDVDWLAHKHPAGLLVAPNGPVTGISDDGKQI